MRWYSMVRSTLRWESVIGVESIACVRVSAPGNDVEPPQGVEYIVLARGSDETLLAALGGCHRL